MNNAKCDGIRNWILGAVATGMMIPSMPALGQSKVASFVNPKKSVRKPATLETTEPPRLLAVPDGGDATSPSIQSASQIIPTAGEKSEVQKQLEAMYEQDGREVPTFNLQPLSPINGQPSKNTTPQQTNSTANPQGRAGQPNAGSTQTPVRPAQGYTQYQPRTQATPYTLQPSTGSPRNFSAAIDAQSKPQPQPQAAPQYLPQYQQSRNPISSLFRRITGQNKYVASQAPMPPEAHEPAGVPPILGVPSASAMPIAARYTAQPRSTIQPVRPMTGPSLATTPVPIQQSAQVQITAGTNSIPAELQAPLILQPPLTALPALSAAPLPLGGISEPSSLPPLMTEPQGANLALKTQVDTGNIIPPSAGPAPDFPNPFTEVTETEADKKNSHPLKGSDAALEPPESAVETKSVERNSDADAAVKTDDDPFVAKRKDFSEPSIDEKLAPGEATVAPSSPQLDSPPASEVTPEISMPKAFDPPTNDDSNPPSDLAPPVAPPSTSPGAITPPEPTVDPQAEKMKRIRERFGMKGLKGFCPVTLHDERELVDARPEFHFTHRSQKFHFATAEARDKFEASPAKYAPAAYGADVVALSRDKDVVEGTLDFAAWFKGRLYLFGTQGNYDVFIAAPAKYATLVEIE